MLDLSYNVSATLNESDCEIGIVVVVVVIFYRQPVEFLFVLSVCEIGIYSM